MPESKSATAMLIDLMRSETVEENGLAEYAQVNGITGPVPVEANVAMTHALADLLEGSDLIGGPEAVALALEDVAQQIHLAAVVDGRVDPEQQSLPIDLEDIFS